MINEIKQWFNSLTMKAKESKKGRQIRHISDMAKDNIQLMEHDNQVFICYRGVPIFPVGEYYDNTDMLDVLKNCREHYKNYLVEHMYGE